MLNLILAIIVLLSPISKVSHDQKGDFMDALDSAIDSRDLEAITKLYGPDASGTLGFRDTIASWKMFFDSLDSGWTVTTSSFYTLDEIPSINSHYLKILKSMIEEPTSIDGQQFGPNLQPIGATVVTRSEKSSNQTSESIDAVGLDSKGALRFIYLKEITNSAEQGAAANP